MSKLDQNKRGISIGRAIDPSIVLSNKFTLDSQQYPGDVVVGFAERHCPLRWIETKLINTKHDAQHMDYIPCMPPLMTKEVVAVKRKDGSYIILAGSIPRIMKDGVVVLKDERIKAHVMMERELTNKESRLWKEQLSLAETMSKMSALDLSNMSLGKPSAEDPTGASTIDIGSKIALAAQIANRKNTMQDL